MKMENINIAELLKDAPRGMELYSPLCGTCKLYDVNDYTIRIETPNKDTLISLYHDGRYCSNGEIMLFPKNKTTWEGFVLPCEFKDGDIVATSSGDWIGITTGGKKGKFIPTYCVIQCDDKFKAYLDRKGEWAFNRLATEEEKTKLFDAIKANGYVWNAETKTLEKLPKFKIGDRVKKKDSNEDVVLITDIADNYYIVETKYGMEVTISISIQNDYELAPNKFDIANLKPFESRVLVRDNKLQKWCPEIWGYYDFDSQDYKYKLIGGNIARYCIPYEKNEHLLGKTDDCDEFYKNWE